MNNNFFAVMVIYNRKIGDSITYNCLKACTQVSLTVCDNSTEDYGNSQAVAENVNYISMGGNAGLAKAYNKAVDALKGNDGYVCLFDDDTSVESNYFELLDAEIEKSNADILLPVVRDETGIMSPCAIDGVLTRRINSLNEINGNNISGINSGMAVKLSVFDSYRYDENYFLDFIDHAFLRDMKKDGRKIAVADSIQLRQSFSANDRNVQRAEKRFKIFKKDYLKFCNDAGSKTALVKGRLYLLKRWVNINIIYRITG